MSPHELSMAFAVPFTAASPCAMDHTTDAQMRLHFATVFWERRLNLKPSIALVILTTSASAALMLGGCATETSRAVIAPKVEAAATAAAYRGPRIPVAVGKFDNRSDYMRGIFSDGVDRLGSQAKTTLIAHMQQSGRFAMLDRDNLAEGKQEAQFQSKSQAVKGAQLLVTGDVTEFGRKEVGDAQLFGILGRGKTQVAYAKVTLNVVNPLTSEVVYSAMGAGEYQLSNREVVGFGGTASYDATLNGKVLDLAIRQAVDNLVGGLDAGQWGAPAARAN